MLKSLSIRNIALIERAEITFAEGLNVLSGETGAGKSVILGSIEFALGGKAEKSMIRHGQSECSVRAEFLGCGEEISKILEEFDIEPEETLILTRKLSLDGKSSAKINGCTVTLAMLRRVTSRLVDIHGQSEHFYLLKESNQLRLLDRIGGEKVINAKNTVQNILARRKDILAQLEVLGGDDSERSRRLDILRFQIDEISRADVKEGEEEELLALREKYAHAEKILSGLNSAREYLQADSGACDAVNGAHRAILQVLKYYDLGSYSERLENVAEELVDIGDSLEGIIDEFDLDENDLARTEARLDEIKSLKRKYGGTVAAMQEFFNRAQDEYELLKEGASRALELSEELVKCEDELFAACNNLTERRKETASTFTKSVEEELKTLNSASARFEVEFEELDREEVGRATGEGLGGVRFLFSANAGEPLKELGKIISGGEMSRFMLAVKAQIASSEGIDCALFDEIDAGIGGKTGKVVAEKFVKIAKSIQIISISHLSQIAAAADRQFLIEKSEVEDRTFTTVRELGAEERRCELARMIAGEVSPLSLEHADEMIKSAHLYKNSL